jgi:hypothetical protein
VFGVHFSAASDIGLGIPRFHRQKGVVIDFRRLMRLSWLVPLFALAGVGAAVFAQIEGADRGVAPVDSSGVLEVGGIEVDFYGKTAEAARDGAWREAQRRGWRLLWAKYHGGGAGPGLSDGALDGVVSAIVVEDEQIGEHRYIARLGVTFDRVRASQLLGVTGQFTRSAPMLVIPIQWSGATPQSFEVRTEWQKAWARFRSGESGLDYVRPSGTGADPLLLNAAQVGRPGRRWWRALLDQYGAADVLIPSVRLERSWPGGPVSGYFAARYGPDNRLIETFTLQVKSSADLPGMMDEGVKRIDAIYNNALAAGLLRPDTSLIIQTPVTPEDLIESTVENAPVTSDSTPVEEAAPAPDETAPATAEIQTFTIQFDTPDVGSVSGTEGTVRGIPGVKSASTTSLALGGTSVMRVSFAGDEGMLKLGLAARGFSVAGGGGSLRISR